MRSEDLSDITPVLPDLISPHLPQTLSVSLSETHPCLGEITHTWSGHNGLSKPGLEAAGSGITGKRLAALCMSLCPSIVEWWSAGPLSHRKTPIGLLMISSGNLNDMHWKKALVKKAGLSKLIGLVACHESERSCECLSVMLQTAVHQYYRSILAYYSYVGIGW